METIFGLIIGVLLTLALVIYMKQGRSKQLTNSQSVILLEKIKSVCKLITVEGEFAEIYHHENIKERLLGLISSKKKALVVINAKAHIGYDLSKIVLEADNDKKRIVLNNMPQPEVLSIEPKLTYYDIQNGLFNKFIPEDLNALHAEAKQFVLDKIPESGLMQTAKKEALEAILIIETIVETIGWKLDYSALEIDVKSKTLLK